MAGTDASSLGDEVRRLQGEVEALKRSLRWVWITVGAVLVLILVGLALHIVRTELRRRKDYAEQHPRLVPLAALLQSLFRFSELVLFLNVHLGPEGHGITGQLSWRLFYRAQVDEIVAALRRRGLPDDPFYDALAAGRPEREAEIRALQRSAA